jgi:hypothetical protein
MSETSSIKYMTAKIELSAEIARIAMAWPSCKGHVVKAVERFRNRKKADSDVGAADGGHSSLLESATNESMDGLTDVINKRQYK